MVIGYGISIATTLLAGMRSGVDQPGEQNRSAHPWAALALLFKWIRLTIMCKLRCNRCKSWNRNSMKLIVSFGRRSANIKLQKIISSHLRYFSSNTWHTLPGKLRCHEYDRVPQVLRNYLLIPRRYHTRSQSTWLWNCDSFNPPTIIRARYLVDRTLMSLAPWGSWGSS